MAMHLPSVSSRVRQRRNGYDDTIVIGLVNNMPDAALQTTEHQFQELLSAACPNLAARLRLFSLPELPRSDAARAHIRQHYDDIGELWTSRLDGLIVTGTEPHAQALVDEPYWLTLTKLVDWAEANTTSTAWSCLAAHAAVLHMDGICRHLLPEKLTGVFECRKAAEHILLAGIPPGWPVPHSRYNDLTEEALVASGYCVLSRLPDAGVDMFARRRNSLFIFMQGHLEYDPGTLFREYRRDIRRFLAGERDSYPEMPRGYFDSDAAAEFLAFREQAVQSRRIDLILRFPGNVPEERLSYSWRWPALRVYANWLSYLAGQKSRTLGSTKSHAAA